ncbi:TRAP transporter large permease [Chloroflexota bacterium]
MEPMMVGLIGIILMLVLLAVGMPVGFGMAFVGGVGIWYFTNWEGAARMLAVIPYNLLTGYSHAVLPLFFFMANITLFSGISRSLYEMVYKWIGRLPGGLSAATIGAATIFGAVSASAVATCLTIGLVSIPEMKKYKYDDGMATACIAAGGVLGILIPPSGILIIYGIMTGQSIGKLFIAGIVPGVILCIMFMTMIVTRCIINPALGPPGPSTTFAEKIKSIGATAEMLLLVVIVIGGLIIGWFTPTEAGAVGAFFAFVFSLARRRLNWQGFKGAVWETASGVGMIYFLLIGAFIFNNFLTMSNIPMELAELVAGLALPKLVIILLILVIYLILGCFIDALAMILLTIPVFFPVAMALNLDPIWFGIVIVLVVGMGMITPPVGIGVYVIAGVAKDVPMGTIFKGIIPFLLVEVVFAALLITFPQIATFLPSLMN